MDGVTKDRSVPNAKHDMYRSNAHQTTHRIVGFEELGNADDFATSALEMRLKVSGVISSGSTGNPLRSMYASAKESRDSDEDQDDTKKRSKIRDSARKEDDDDFDL